MTSSQGMQPGRIPWFVFRRGADCARSCLPNYRLGGRGHGTQDPYQSWEGTQIYTTAHAHI